jgi:hypothetical protein
MSTSFAIQQLRHPFGIANQRCNRLLTPAERTGVKRYPF